LREDLKAERVKKLGKEKKFVSLENRRRVVERRFAKTQSRGKEKVWYVLSKVTGWGGYEEFRRGRETGIFGNEHNRGKRSGSAAKDWGESGGRCIGKGIIP